jgi:hypothetical protein
MVGQKHRGLSPHNSFDRRPLMPVSHPMRPQERQSLRALTEPLRLFPCGRYVIGLSHLFFIETSLLEYRRLA